MIEMFQEWYDSRHEYAKNWKEKNGGKVMGYFCTYVPEEMLYAADGCLHGDPGGKEAEIGEKIGEWSWENDNGRD